MHVDNHSPQAEIPEALLSARDVLKRVPFAKSTLHKLASNGGFPKPVLISPGRVAWVESEVQDWISEQIAERDELLEKQAEEAA